MIASVSVVAILAAIVILDGRRTEQDTEHGRFDWLGALVSTAALVRPPTACLPT